MTRLCLIPKRCFKHSGIASVIAVLLLFPTMCFAGVVISEFLAVNNTEFEDEDGETSDWIELFNSSDVAVDLNGWYLTDDVTALTKWQFPAVTIQSGEFLVVFASGKDRRNPASELHTNFQLADTGEYLGLIEADGITIAHEYRFTYPEQRMNCSYGLIFSDSVILDEGAAVSVKVPAGDSMGTTWTQEGFTVDGTWTNGTTSVGYFTPPTVQTAGTLFVDLNADDLALGLVSAWNNRVSGGGTFSRGSTNPQAQMVDGVKAVTFDGNDRLRWNNIAPAGVTGNNSFTIEIWVYNPELLDEECVVNWAKRWGPSGSTGQINYGTNPSYGAVTHWDWPDMGFDTGVPTPGKWHHFVDTYEGGTNGMEKLYVDGELCSFEAKTLNLHNTTPIVLGAAYQGNDTGLELYFTGSLAQVRVHDGALTAEQARNNFLAHASQFGALAGMTPSLDIQAQMYGINATAYMRLPFTVADPSVFDWLMLDMAYDDGYVAYINGTEVARGNSPALPAWNSNASAEHEYSVNEEVNIGDHLDLLHTGTNVLAVHGMNIASNNNDFMILPKLSAAGIDTETQRYFFPPSPGSTNEGDFLDFVDDTKFTVDRGFYSSPIEVGISCLTPGAEIRYTLDYSTPTATHGTVYGEPISITGTTILRAAAFKDGWKPSNVDTQTYFYVSDIITQSPSGEAPGPAWPSGWPNGQRMDYGLDPDVTGDPRYAALMDDAMLSIPSISLVSDMANFFDTSIGIYVNPMNHGRAWERPTSVELINPDGSPGFQVEAGMRIRGMASRGGGNPKHAFRLFFRSEYGDPKLNFPLFGPEGTDSFDKVDLRCEQNYSWSKDDDLPSRENTLVKDVFSRDLQREMGQPYTRSRYYHLFINGHYWGVYQTQERAEANYGESYFGGDDSDYDVAKAADTWPRKVEITDGTIDSFQRLWSKAVAGFSTNAAYFQAQGMNADGTRNPAYERLLDVDNVIVYELSSFYTGDFDGPLCLWYGDGSMNNVYAVFNRNNPDGYKFFRHDAEHSIVAHRVDDPDLAGGWLLGYYQGSVDRTGPFGTGSLLEDFNPQYLHDRLTATNAEYRIRFADIVHKHFYHDGVLTPAGATALFQSRAEEIQLAIIGESARWGDANNSPARTKDDNWLVTLDRIYNDFMPARTGVVLQQLRDDGLYPNVEAPDYRIDGSLNHGGTVDSGAELTITAPAGAVYYGLNGVDPRLIGGAINPSAAQFTGSPIVLTSSTLVKSRAYSGGTWSAVCEAFYLIAAASPNDIVISEVMPNVVGQDDNKEWFEVYNTTDSPVNIDGWVISDNGTDTHTISNGGSLIVPAKSHLVLGESTDPLVNGGAPVDYAYGPTDITLANDGDEIILSEDGQVIHAIGYEVYSPTPTAVLDVQQNADPGLAIGMGTDYCDGPATFCQVHSSFSGAEGNPGPPGADNDDVNVCSGGDTLPPELVKVAFGRRDLLYLRFNEPLDASTAEDELNYTVDNSVGNPTLAVKESAAVVLLEFAAPLLSDVTYTVTIEDVEDLNDNAIVSEQGSARFHTPEVSITEIMYNNRGTDVEWIELLNTTAGSINLSGWYLTDDDSYPATDEGQGTIPSTTIINPGQYVIVNIWDDVDFGNWNIPGNVAVIDTVTIDVGSLSNTGDNLALYNSAVGGDLIDGSTSADFPDLTEDAGESLEKIDVLFPWGDVDTVDYNFRKCVTPIGFTTGTDDLGDPLSDYATPGRSNGSGYTANVGMWELY